jgi:hypothetical protein
VNSADKLGGLDFAPEFAVLLVEDSAEQRVKVAVRNTSVALVQNIWLDKVSLDLAMLDDMNGNRTAELAILRSKPEKGWVSVLIADGLSAAEINNLPYNINFTPLQLAVVPDLNGNDSVELAQYSAASHRTAGSGRSCAMRRTRIG